MSQVTKKQPVATPKDFPPFEGKLELRCTACGKKGKYSVGRIFIDPQRVATPDQEGERLEDSVGFTGYFHCRQCGAGGPWEFTATAKLQLMALVMEASWKPKQARVVFGRAQLFDGTVIRTATEGETHLRQLIEANPGDGFLWSRLGNLYDSADEVDRAFTAYTRAVELNPKDVESHYTLGCYEMDKNHQPARAAEHFTQVLRHCRTAPPRQPGLAEDIVRDTLDRLFKLHNQSKGAIDFLPMPEPPPAGTREKEPRQVVVQELDLSREVTWEALTQMYLTGRFPGVPGARRAPRLALPRPVLPAQRTSERVGRNDPCPCGSGKKFKQCCARDR